MIIPEGSFAMKIIEVDSFRVAFYSTLEYFTVPVPIRNAKTILTFQELLKYHLFDLALPP